MLIFLLLKKLFNLQTPVKLCWLEKILTSLYYSATIQILIPMTSSFFGKTLCLEYQSHKGKAWPRHLQQCPLYPRYHTTSCLFTSTIPALGSLILYVRITSIICSGNSTNIIGISCTILSTSVIQLYHL